MLLGVALALLFASASPAAPARAAATTCTFEFEVVASPGLTTSPSSGKVATRGEDGKGSCDGPVNGKQPTGDGTAGFDGRYGTKDGDTCQAGGEGDGVQSYTIPTSAGPQKIKNTVTYNYGAFKAGSAFSGSFEGDRMSGTFDVQPVDGDCASKPVTKFRVKGKGTFKA